MLIKGATIINGAGTRKTKGDVRIQGKYIVAIGDIKAEKGEEVLNAQGLYLTPGFIDILNHSDAYLTIFQNPTQESLLRQGITTILTGNCGSSLAPLVDGGSIRSIQKWTNTSQINVNWQSLKEYFRELEKHNLGVNIGTLIGHSTIRRGLIGDEARQLTKAELQLLEYMLETSLAEGAFGVSAGLAYAHGKPATQIELERIARIVKNSNTFLAMHMRNESGGLFESILEGITLAQKQKVSVEFSHLKSTGKEAQNQFVKVLDIIENTSAANFDVYPYTTTASVLYTFLPEWLTKDGNIKLLPAIKDLSIRKKLVKEMQKDPHDYNNMIIAMGALNNVYFGKTIKEIAKSQEISPEECILNLTSISGNRVIVYTQAIKEENLKTAITHPNSFIASSGAGYSLRYKDYGELPHPRSFGAMPKFLEIFVVQEKLLSWEKAIKKITLGPAQKIGLKNRGKIETGYFADLVLLNPKTIHSSATTTNPYQYPNGIEYVFVNGTLTVAHNKLTTRTAGKVLKKE